MESRLFYRGLSICRETPPIKLFTIINRTSVGAEQTLELTLSKARVGCFVYTIVNVLKI